MADSAPPRHVSRQLFQAARPVHASASIPRAGLAGGAIGGGALARSFGTAQGGSRRVEPDDVTDPAVSGEFARNPLLTNIFGSFGGDLSPRGKAQQEVNQRLKQYGQQINQLTQQGASFSEAFQHLVKTNPSAMDDLWSHPQALRSMEHLQQALHPDEGSTPVGLSKSGSQVLQRDAQGNLSYSNIPGYEAPPEKPGPWHATTAGFMQPGPGGTATPVLDAQGNRVMPVPTGKQQTALGQSDIAGLPPQQTSDTPKTQFNRQNYNLLAATPEVMAALERMHKAADAMGPVKGPIATLSGEYFGINGTGAQFKADQDLIRTQAQKMTGSAYAANTKNFMEGIGTASQAASFIKLQSGQMMNTLRNEGQEIADKETADHQGKLPPALVNNLTKAGIVPNGYQNRETLDQMPPGEAALWKSRFFPQTLDDADKAQLATDAANGKFGSPGAQNTNADFKNIVGIRQKDKAQEQARQQQQTASTAAQAAQVAPSPAAAVLPEAGAQQPQQPAQQGQQQPQQRPAQAPQQSQPNGRQGQNNQPGQGAPPTDASNIAALTGQAYPANIPGSIQPPQLMPPQAVPGQPAQGMPATSGGTPQPPASPLPLATSQTLTPQGGMPTPATQAPLTETLPNASASAPLPPLEAATLQLLQQNNVPTDQINNQQTSGAPGPQ